MPVLVLHNWTPRLPALGRLAGEPATWCALAAVLLVLSALTGDLRLLADWLGDTDDAVRLVTVRELIAGASWFDTTLPRIGAPEPLLSHWSRLIDLPLALSIGLLSPMLGPERAELVTRIAWPLMLLVALQIVVVREAHRRGGSWAAAFAIVLTLTCATALVQFRPGRIDHHNAQVLCAVAGLLFLARSLDDQRTGWVAGVLLGLGLSIGYEAIALVAAALALAAPAAIWQPRYGAGVARAAVAAVAVMFAVLVATVPPSRWLDVRCDALSLNLPVLAACCAVGLWVALRFAGHAKPALRFAISGVAALVGLLGYVALEPACLAGPFGQVNPALRPIWLDHVMEIKSVFWLAGRHPAPVLTFLVFVLAGAAAQAALWRRERDASTTLMTAIVVLAALLGCWQLRLMSYASWLAIVPLAVWCARLPGSATLSAPLARIAAIVVLNQAVLAMAFDAGVGAVRWASRSQPPAAHEAQVSMSCARSSSVGRLATLSPGLVAADLDLGPYVVATTAHRVVAAPYHRLDKGILANHAILEGTPEQAQRELAALGVSYLALCAPPTPTANAGDLRARLLAGQRIGFLQELDIGSDTSVRVWRVVNP